MLKTLSVLCVFFSLIAVELCAQTVNISSGSGQFIVAGGVGRVESKITVFYHRPKHFDADSPIIMVLPGSGRTASKYRDRWVATSEKHNVLVLSPRYSKSDYPKSANYNLARMVTKKKGEWTIRKSPNEWIFSDLDRIFERVVKVTGSKQKYYDFFGHSAGGQIGHRLAIFYPSNKANRIFAANAGWYTATDFEEAFPYGLTDGPFERDRMQQNLRLAYAKKLTIFLGEKDNHNETRGALRQDEQANKQGGHRLARGQYFFNQAKQQAKQMGYPFNWRIQVVPNVGHSATKMSHAAAQALYGKATLTSMP